MLALATIMGSDSAPSPTAPSRGARLSRHLQTPPRSRRGLCHRRVELGGRRYGRPGRGLVRLVSEDGLEQGRENGLEQGSEGGERGGDCTIVFLGCRCGSLVAIVGWRSSSDSDDGVKWPEIGGFVGTAPSLSGEMGADGDSATISPGGLGAARQLKDFQD